ncbi:MAG TPA: hypothetical protein ENI23_04235 [bacterium]|nr:hypothetical protein [bacterium]
MKKVNYTTRGMEIVMELVRADINSEPRRCLAEYLAHLETNACSRSKSTNEIENFKFYEDE